ncbi:hypothetical protein [Kytococcus sedentarius]|uniref:hypothetical protein n=1 Tax=Kytococcus sedentarius TaxID=1276 RepID=UPI001951FDBD|nr:hypothetical protein [Kytococcus sedentarius]QRO86887.1 hypothetical protein I6J30_08490 [Kytococcus sedentarius]
MTDAGAADHTAAVDAVRRALASREAALAAGARAEQELVDAVHAARRVGLSWQQLADLLGVTRQAAAQRFGGGPTDAPPVPGRSPLYDHGGPVDDPVGDRVGRLATTALERLLEHDIATLRRLLSSTARRQLTHQVLSELAEELPDTVGPVWRLEPPTTHTPEGAVPATGALPLVARIELVAEHGRPVAHVLVGRAGSIAGLSIRPSDAHESWPL